MKKSTFIVLTIVAAFSLSGCAVQNVPQNAAPPDPMYADVDAVGDTTRHYPAPIVQYPVVQYDYYYRSYFFDDLYRCFFPGRYYHVISQPGFEPRHKRPIRSSATIAVHRSRSMPSSSRRGGFGRTGSVHSVVS